MTSPEQMDGRRELVQAQSDLRKAENISSVHGVAIAGAIADARQQGYLKAIEDAVRNLCRELEKSEALRSPASDYKLVEAIRALKPNEGKS